MDDSSISPDPTHVQPVEAAAPKRRFWTLRMRKQTQDGADDAEPASSRTSDAAKSWKLKSGNKRERKSRLTIWKTWFLSLVKSKSKSSLTMGLQEADSIGLNSIPSLVMNQPPFSIATDSIMDTWRRATEANLVMVIIVPENIPAKDLKMNVELKALPKTNNKDLEDLQTGLHLVEQSPTGPVYFGTVKVPPLTNIIQISKMPLYIVNPKSSKNDPKIETVIQPAETTLPEACDETMIIEDIALRIDFETKLRFDVAQLEYEFRLDSVPLSNRNSNMGPNHSSMISLDLDPFISSTGLNTIDLIDQITKEPAVQCYNETSKSLVKEILSEVVSKISLTSTDFIENFHKELELQKSLLLETTSSILPNSDSLLSKISETDQEEVSSTSKVISEVKEDLDSNQMPRIRSATCLYQISVPANSPNSGMLPYIQKMSSSTKEEMCADIDRTLELLETAKNRLLKYLNRGCAQMQDACGKAESSQEDILETVGKETVALSAEPFNHFEDLQCLPEVTTSPVDEKPPDVEPVVDPVVSEDDDDEWISDEEDSTVQTRLLTNPVNEMHQLLLEEFHKVTGIDITGKETFDLEDLAKGNIFVDEEKIDDMTDDYIQEADFYLMGEYWNVTLNDEVFESRFAEDHQLSAFAKERLDDDIAIMVREIKEESEDIKQICIRKIRANKVIKDVQSVLESIVQRVEKHISHNAKQLALVPVVPQVSPVYFCLIDEYVDVFLTAGRAGGWITERFRALTDTERKSTVSVRRISAQGLGGISTHALEIYRPESLLQNLEKGCAYLSELYKEIFSRNLNYLSDNHRSTMEKKTDDRRLPLVRKSKRLYTFEKKNVPPREDRSSAEEEVETIIEPEQDVPKESVQNHSIEDPYLEFSKWPAWKRSWIKILTKQHSSNELDGFRQLNDLVTIKPTVYSLLKVASDPSMIGPCKSHRVTKKLRIKPFEIQMEALVNFMDNSKDVLDDIEKAKKVSFANTDEDDDNLNKDLSKKKSFKTNSVPAFHDDPAVPGPSTASGLFVMHESENIPAVSHMHVEHGGVEKILWNEKFPRPVADVPRGFASSSMEQAYMNNLGVLQHNMFKSSLESLQSLTSSSQDSYRPAPAEPNAESDCFILPLKIRGPSESSISNTNFVLLSYSSSDFSNSSIRDTIPSSDYNADTESLQFEMPRPKITYVSKSEVNKPEEISRIEREVYQNDYYNPPMKSLSEVVFSNIEPNLPMGTPSSASSLSLKSTEVDLHKKD